MSWVFQSVNGWVPEHMTPLGGGVRDLSEGLLQIRRGLVDGAADTGDDLDGRLEQLVLRLGVLAAGVGCPDLVQDRGGGRGQLTSLAVDEFELPLDAEARPLR